MNTVVGLSSLGMFVSITVGVLLGYIKNGWLAGVFSLIFLFFIVLAWSEDVRRNKFYEAEASKPLIKKITDTVTNTDK